MNPVAAPAVESRSPATSPVQSGSKRAAQSIAVASADRDTEYRLIRRDLWRLTIYSGICLALMIGVLVVLG